MFSGLVRNGSCFKKGFNDQILKIGYRNSHFIVLPEIPPDTPSTNPIMRNEVVPALSELTPKLVQSGVQKLVVNFEIEMVNLFENEKIDKTYKRTFKNVFDTTECELAPVDYAQKTARHLAFKYPYSLYHNVFLKLDRKVNAMKNERYRNKNFYKALLELNSSRHLMNEKELRILDRSLRSCVLNGQKLNAADFDICQQLNARIQQKQQEFNDRLQFANRSFGIRISDKSIVENLPSHILKIMSHDRSNPDKGPWTVPPNDEVFESFMKYCSNQTIRRTLFEAYYSLASYSNEHFETNNSAIIKEILEYRKRQAELYGYKNFAELVVENKAALKIENVLDLFEKIRLNLKPVADDQLDKLQKFAEKNGNTRKFENYDLDYWKTVYNRLNYGVDEAQLTAHFPYRKVLNGLFHLTKLLFNVEFKKDESHSSKMMDRSTEIYNLHDENGAHLSTLIFETEMSNQNIWGYSGRESSEVAGMKPLAYLNMNVSSLGASTCLSFNQVKKLFFEFGGVIQTLLTSTVYTESSDRFMVETDAINLNNQLFKKFVYVPEVMALISEKTMPDELLTRLKNYDHNLEVFGLMKQTFLSAFDVECHMSDMFWYNIMEELWPKFMPIQLAKTDYRPCQFRAIFGENYGCNYYSFLWSEMLVSDLFEAFNDVGFQDKTKLKDVGIKYRETFLKNGASLNINEVFRQFRGRNPSMDPFIKSYLTKQPI